MKTVIRTLLSSILLVSAVANAHASGHPNLARGFEPEKLYQFNDVDSVNIYNGNLTATVPLGQEFKGNGTLRYRFSLVYNSKAWDYERKYYNGSSYPKGMFNKAVPSKTSNAGMGWTLTLGRLIAPQDPSNDPNSINGHEWTFQDTSGAVHRFPGTYAATDPASPVHTKDSSYLRLTKPATNTRDVAHPDGTRYRFIEGGNQYWLYQIFDAFNNYVRIRYYDAAGAEILLTSSYANAMSWKATEYTNGNALVRTHTVRFENRSPLNAPSNYLRQVKWVDLAGFNGTVSSYELSYVDTLTQYGCGGDWRDTYTPNPTVPLLMSVYLPDASTQSAKSRYDFTYHTGDCTGSLATMTLPTLGKISYTYNFYQLPTSACIGAMSTYPDTDPQEVFSSTSGLTKRELFNPAGTKIAEQTYTPSLQLSGYTYYCPNGMTKQVHGTATISLESDAAPGSGKRTRTEHSFSVWPDIAAQGSYSHKDYAAPYTRAMCPAGSGLCLSTKTFECISGNCGTPKRETYLQYEADNGSSPDLANRRLARTRTVYKDDGDRFVETKHSQYDGHGHYRREETFTGTGASTTTGTLVRTRFTNYNPLVGTTTVDPITWTPSSTASTITGAWILNTYTDGYAQQHSGGTLSTERAQYCFSTQGQMTRQRRMRSTGITSADLLTHYTYDTLGNRTREEHFGGELNSIGTTATCSVSPSHNAHTYRLDHTWNHGALATSRYVNGSTGVALTHYEVDREIDQHTGLVKAEWQGRTPGLTDGIRTAFDYDALARRTWTKQCPSPTTCLPTVDLDAWTQLTYTRATSASSPASVLLQHYANGTTTSPIAQARYDFDGFGRLLREGMLAAAANWMYRETLRDGLGRATSVSEWEMTLSPTPRTATSYDWAGRPTMITPPAGSATTFTYTGDRITSRKQWLATSSGGGESQAETIEERDLLGHLISVREPNLVTTTYTYDVADRLRQVCSNNTGTCGQTRTFTYDARGLLTAETHPEKSTTQYFNFDARRNATQSYVSSSLSDFAHIYAFDRAGRPTTVTQTATGRLIKEFTYGTTNTSGNRVNGKLQNAKRWNWHDRFSINGLVTETYTYGGRGGRPSARTTAVETYDYATPAALLGQKLFSQTWTWNDLGDPLVTGYPVCSGLSPCNVAGARNITHDYTNGWLTNVREGSSSWGSISYHSNGMVNTVTHNNLVQSVYAKDPLQMQRPASVSATYGTTTYWTSGTYLYDSSGNVRATGNDYYVYDLLGRLTQGTSERTSSSVYKQQNQTYDLYGNITNIATIINGATTNRGISVNSATNRLNSTSYDVAGNQLSWDSVYTYGYDSQNMMRSQVSSNRDILYLYTADDERIWKYDLIANRSDYTIRDLDKKVLRVFDENQGVWVWKKDMIHRSGAILGSASYAGSYHYTVDHLGTPRYISNASRAQVGRHAYYPFGQESTSDTQNQEFLKFTGHERDTNFTGTLDYLDYMHARYYSPVTARFLSVDPTWISADLAKPQSWNRYGYVMNNPINMTDPDGKCPSSLTGRPCANPLNGTALVVRRERNNPINGEFGMTRNQGTKPHQGVDLLSKKGTPVTAADSGRIVFAGEQKGHGNIVIIAHQNADGKDVSFTSYSHLDSRSVKKNDTVESGQQVGSVGRSGNLSDGIPTHLHFEIRKQQEPGKGEQGLKKRVDPGPELGLESKKRDEQ